LSYSTFSFYFEIILIELQAYFLKEYAVENALLFSHRDFFGGDPFSGMFHDPFEDRMDSLFNGNNRRPGMYVLKIQTTNQGK
jgi:hypothetical protein